MSINSDQVKKLRLQTGMGMLECKKALVDACGDFEKAIILLREKGLSRADNKSSRTASQGIVNVLVDKNKAVILEINCETDFASNSDKFKNFVNDISNLILKNEIKDLESLIDFKIKDQNVEKYTKSVIAQIGENIQIKRFRYIGSNSNNYISKYMHMGGKIGVLVVFNNPNNIDIADISKDIAMHIAASFPKYLSSKDIPKKVIDIEMDIARKKLSKQSKPDHMINNILKGQINKFYKEVCLLNQPFIKDLNQSVDQVLKSKFKNVSILEFERYQLGNS